MTTRQHAWKRWFSVLAMVTIVVSAAGVFAQGENPAHVFLLEAANIRECPRLTCAVAASFPQFAELIVLGTESGDTVGDSDEWLLVQDEASGAQGYVHRSLTAEQRPDVWQLAPIIPTVSDAAREVYALGQELGNDPHVFSVIGDCQNISEYFLAVFDRPQEYDLGDYADLQATVDYFAGSFARERAAVQPGYNVASVLSPLWADPDVCDKGENPLECEYNLHHPSFVIVSMETWWEGRPADDYERYLRQVVAFWMENGVVPILATKADNLEGDHGINAAIARVAQETEMPLWNFWLAVQPLPDHGLEDDGFHLTYARNFFGDADVMQMAWPVRNLTALQALDAVRRGVVQE